MTRHLNYYNKEVYAVESIKGVNKEVKDKWLRKAVKNKWNVYDIISNWDKDRFSCYARRYFSLLDPWNETLDTLADYVDLYWPIRDSLRKVNIITLDDLYNHLINSGCDNQLDAIKTIKGIGESKAVDILQFIKPFNKLRLHRDGHIK